MNLALVRHGETNWNLESRIQGWMDVGLTKDGRAEAQDLVETIPAQRYPHLASSSLRRATETADVLLQGGPWNQLHQYDSFRELDQGYWNGLTDQAVRHLDEARYTAWQQNPTKNPPPGGESLQELRSRVASGLQELEQVGGSVLLVAHKVVNSMILHLAGERNFSQVLSDLPGNLALVETQLEPADLDP